MKPHIFLVISTSWVLTNPNEQLRFLAGVDYKIQLSVQTETGSTYPFTFLPLYFVVNGSKYSQASFVVVFYPLFVRLRCRSNHFRRQRGRVRCSWCRISFEYSDFSRLWCGGIETQTSVEHNITNCSLAGTKTQQRYWSVITQGTSNRRRQIDYLQYCITTADHTYWLAGSCEPSCSTVDFGFSFFREDWLCLTSLGSGNCNIRQCYD